jgi:hypothetical protein
MPRNAQIAAPPDAARRAGCPFCAARIAARPDVGDRVVVLNRFRAGMVGTVSHTDIDGRFHPGTFLIKADGDKPGVEQIINPHLDLFSVLSARKRLPDWLPPLCMRETAELDEIVLAVCDRYAKMGSPKWNAAPFYRLIEHCWRNRLPLSSDEVWVMLEAHGIPKKFEKEVRRAYIEGTQLLVYSHGRKPIKKKRVKPLSVSTANPTVERDGRQQAGARPSL